MLGFTPFKKHANKFNYIPRYYDPEKEAREQRRAELHGERAEDAGREYKPGQYIRTQREARAARRAGEDKTGQGRILKMAAAAVLALLIAAGRWNFWASEQVSPLTQVLFFPGLLALALLAGLFAGWRFWKWFWRPRVVDGR